MKQTILMWIRQYWAGGEGSRIYLAIQDHFLFLGLECNVYEQLGQIQKLLSTKRKINYFFKKKKRRQFKGTTGKEPKNWN